jgi:eukaryotic-like serine/threonine-protein kinase
MPLASGTRLGAYEITSRLGSGGMGDVYRARDAKLGRDVAIKILSEAVVADPERVARFQREAQLLAALNHPRIGAIYSFEEAGATKFLVLELVEGQTLADRLARGPLPVSEALAIARQIIDALEAAHDKGIVHRDLKPANIALDTNGDVKVLDFGLAKATDASASGDAANSPTITFAATQMGVILGTAAYMSPEQAKGRTTDKRSDVWAFGCVLFEMLTGRRAFHGEDVSDTLATVLKSDADWSALPGDVPDTIRDVLRRCLDKDRRTRIPDMAVVRFLLDEPVRMPDKAAATRGSVRPEAPRWRRALPWIVAAAGVVSALATVAAWRPWQAAAPAPLMRFPLVLRDDQQFSRPGDLSLAISPDGSRMAYVANRQLFVRAMDQLEPSALPGTNVDPATPFFSPDGRWIGFFSYQDATLRKVSADGGPTMTLCRLNLRTGAINLMSGASWSGGEIVFAQPGRGILRVADGGGEVTLIAKTTDEETPSGPQLVQGNSAVLYTVTTDKTAERWDRADIVAQAIGSSERKVLVRGGSDARYLPTGHLVYALGGSLLAIPFDTGTLEVRGAPVPVLEGVARSTQPVTRGGFGQFAVSNTGSLVYVPGSPSGVVESKLLALADRSGSVNPLDAPPQAYVHPRLSPDGRRYAVATEGLRESTIWIGDVTGGAPLRRLTIGGRNMFPIWSPDGRHIAYQSDREGDAAIFKQLADGSGIPERITKPDEGLAHEPESWSPDGRTISFNLQRGLNQGVWTVTVDAPHTVKSFVDSPGVEKHSSFSPNGKWLAYTAVTAAGIADTQVFIQPFPPTGVTYPVALEGRTSRWSRDGRQLYYHQFSTNQLYVMDIQTNEAVSAGKPTALPISGTIHPQAQRNYDVTPDGRFLVIVPATMTRGNVRRPTTAINVVLNWFEELKGRVPAR